MRWGRNLKTRVIDLTRVYLFTTFLQINGQHFFESLFLAKKKQRVCHDQSTIKFKKGKDNNNCILKLVFIRRIKKNEKVNEEVGEGGGGKRREKHWTFQWRTIKDDTVFLLNSFITSSETDVIQTQCE